jgi:hypothetical protein
MMTVKNDKSVIEAYGDASDAEWDGIREQFGVDIVYYPEIFKHLVSELRTGKLDERLNVTPH